MTKTALEWLDQDEGNIDHVYYLNNIPHVGVGHNLLNGPPLSAAVRAMIRDDDIQFFRDSLEHLSVWPDLSEPRREVLLNLCFWVGFQGLLKFERMFNAVKAKAYEQAGDEIVASELPDHSRRDRLARQMRSGERQ